MDEFDLRVFTELFREVYTKCFGNPLSSPLSESDSKHLSYDIEEQTGLVIGWKSLKNYATFILSEQAGKPENPSIATLDTLARYVANAPATTEGLRKKTESHFPYWFRYRELFSHALEAQPTPKRSINLPVLLISLTVLVVASLLFFVFFRSASLENITENFHALGEDYLARNGWFVQAKSPDFWNRRGEKPGQLTLFTLKGDNWHKAGEEPIIRNLLLHTIKSECFTTEIHLRDFIPATNWQQAGLLLLEDTTFTGKSIRVSLAYNDFFGGYIKPGEILIQATASSGSASANLEEFIHQPLFSLDNPAENQIVINNLKYFALRIEKRDRRLRVLYSASPVDNFSFKEITTYESDIKPRFVGLFALKGFVDSSAVMPIAVRFFRLEGQSCQ